MNRAAEKKAWEIAQGQLVAAEINSAEKSDYVVQEGDREPADVVLISPSRRYQARSAQVVSIPLDFRHRDDKQTVNQVQTRVARSLNSAGMHDVLVGIILSGQAEMHGVTPELLDSLTNLIIERGRRENVSLRYQDIYDYSEALAERVHDVFVSHHPELIFNAQVDIPAGSSVPRDGRWIEEGIAKKLGKYGGEAAVRDLTLIIGVAGFVDAPQVQAFKDAFTESQLPFEGIWINTPFEGTICLKHREN